MAKYRNTKAKINEKIATNGRQAVTGAILNDVLQTMVDSLGADYQFGGLVQPGSSFTAGEQPVVFLATTPGTYTNFGGLVVADGEVALLVWSSTAWSKQTPDIATRTEVSQLGQQVEGFYRFQTYNVTENVAKNTSGNPINVDIPANTKISINVKTESLSYPKTATLYLKNATNGSFVTLTNQSIINYPLEIEKDFPISAIAFKATFDYTGSVVIEVKKSKKSLIDNVNDLDSCNEKYLLEEDKDSLYPQQGNLITFENKVILEAGKHTLKAVASSPIEGRTLVRLVDNDSTLVANFEIASGSTENSVAFTLEEQTECRYQIFTDTVRLIDVEIKSGEYLPERISSIESEVANLGEDLEGLSRSLQQKINDVESISESLYNDTYVLSDNIVSKNILDLSTYRWTKGLMSVSGTVTTDNRYYYSELIPVTPGTTLYTFACIYIICYDGKKVIQPEKGSTSTLLSDTFVVPDGIYFIRTNALDYRIIRNDGDIQQFAHIYEGQDSEVFIPFQNDIRNKNIYKHLKLHDALYAWMNGEKFPVAFFGDSTTDGVGTTDYNANTNSHEHADQVAGGEGKADWQHPYAYPYILEQMLRSELKNNILRIYNAGWGGWSMKNSLGISNFSDIFGYAYSDVKMVGIVMGLNDRSFASSPIDYYTKFKSQLIQACNILIKMGITPFMVSYNTVTQAGAGSSGYNETYQNFVQKLANNAKKEVAELFGLEYVDMNEFGSLVLRCSDYPMGGSNSANGVTENLHFKDLGHRLEAGFLFTKFVPWVLKTESTNKLYIGLSNPNFKCDIVMQSNTWTQDGFKVEINKTKDDTNNVCIYDAYVFNNSVNGPYNVTYQTPVASGYIVVDGDTANPITIDSTNVVIGTWDIGLHHVQVYTGESTTVAFKGFLLEQN